jgi:hypothetical protein
MIGLNLLNSADPLGLIFMGSTTEEKAAFRITLLDAITIECDTTESAFKIWFVNDSVLQANSCG